jgi:hypothetical protein
VTAISTDSLAWRTLWPERTFSSDLPPPPIGPFLGGSGARRRATREEYPESSDLSSYLTNEGSAECEVNARVLLLEFEIVLPNFEILLPKTEILLPKFGIL